MRALIWIVFLDISRAFCVICLLHLYILCRLCCWLVTSPSSHWNELYRRFDVRDATAHTWKEKIDVIMPFNGNILICTCPSSVVPIACLYCFIICAIVKVYCCNPPQRALIRNQYRIYVQNMVFIVIIIISTLVVSYPITNVSHQAPYGACLQVQWCLAQLCPIACKLVVVISLHGLVFEHLVL